jgi:hypothetical protein
MQRQINQDNQQRGFSATWIALRFREELQELCIAEKEHLEKVRAKRFWVSGIDSSI